MASFGNSGGRTGEPHAAETPPANPRVTLSDLSNEILINIISHIPLKIQLKHGKRPYGDRPLMQVMFCSK
jgi:hypothetical protein